MTHLSLFLTLLLILSFSATKSIASVPSPNHRITGVKAKGNKEPNDRIKSEVKRRLNDFAKAVDMAMRNLDEEEFLYQRIKELPPSILSISVLDSKGMVKDSTNEESISEQVYIPTKGEALENHYYMRVRTTRGNHIILIVTTEP